jgi:hypothetical protein
MTNSTQLMTVKKVDKPEPIPRQVVLKEVPSGQIRIEDGADGTYLLFDCECLDALPYCRAQCCALRGTIITPEEYHSEKYQAYWDEGVNGMVLKRDADGFCYCLDRENKRCNIYEDRPKVCRNFHCTRDANARGWKLANHVHRQNDW